ncbi:glutamine amidotransferase-related protein [Microbacterium oleivorans]|uniref:glutamine amidotransferase-related protein n=1 Tax=Microbacterium oleivorans TaxID=273677 RepID=UPI0020403513|nr:GMP synthase [Microbacterium oleivorans]MCM3695364.1 GMP synthase [Microbacterium oleivorans]
MAPLVYLCVRPQVDAADGEYASFQHAMGVDDAGLERWNLVEDALPDDAFDRWRGFVVGGSPFNTTDADDTKPVEQRRIETGLGAVARAAASGRTTALFTCFGIGVASRALGGEVTRDYPERTGPTGIRLTEEGRRDPLFGDLAAEFSALTAHKEGISRLPEGAVLLATNHDCPVQAYRLGHRLYATQFHPEPTGVAFTERMTIYRNHGYFDANDFDAVAARVLAADLDEPQRLLRRFAASF